MREKRTERPSRLTVSGIEVSLVRKSMKTLRMRIAPEDGRVLVSAPFRAGDEQIRSFVRANMPWIEEKRAALAAMPVKAKREYVSGESCPLWGESHPLLVRPGGKNAVELSDGAILMTARPDSSIEQREKLLYEWYRAELRRAVEEALPRWESITGLHPESWQSKRMKTRWGTCNTRTKKLWLNLYLAQRPRECFEYVLLHELAHLRYADHGARFKALLDCYMPDWRQRKKLLNSAPPEEYI